MIRSSSTPPKIIAPNRPLPSGKDCSNLVAGAENDSDVEGLDAVAVMTVINMAASEVVAG